ncbi:MAG: ABC transporter substrate-binding protein [Lachnospiraceae bacterium]|nr:ABC transporter substrate-binding protein [Lachnospiraceae bacterium]
MKLKKVAAAALAATMVVSLAACGGNKSEGGGSSEASDVKYSDITLGEDYTDLEAEIKLLTNRTDMMDSEYKGKNWDSYLADFNKDYPGIKVEIEGITDYAQDSLLRLQGGDWGDIMMIPEVDKSDLSSYFLSYGDLESVSSQVKYPNRWLYGGEVYGIPCTVVGRGIVYNKKVFADAGITESPKTTEEFMNALKAIKEKTDAVPLYTNYAAGWTMGAWDDYTAVTATGDAKFRNQEFAHKANPFSDPGDGTGAYNVYKILYDAVAEGLTEDDFATTDWEGSKSMLNSGTVGCMVLGSWAYPQMQQAGDTPENVGYMPFPMTIDGKQYSPADEDYCFGINADDDADKQTASMVFVKWMTEKSGYSYNEGGLPIAVGDEEYSEVYQEFLDNNVEFVSNEPAVEGEEDLLNELNAESELMVGAGGNDKVQAIVEHASNKDMTFDEIMNEWNEKWTTAQDNLGIETK